MKKITLISILLLCIISLPHLSHAQEALSFSKVVQADSIDKSALFASINEWFATNYNSSTDVIQMSDKEAGIIIGKGGEPYSLNATHSSFDGTLKYTIQVTAREGRYKIEMENFTHDDSRAGGKYNLGLVDSREVYTNKGIYKAFFNKVWTDLQNQCEKFSNMIFDSLEIHTSNANSEEDNW